MADATMEEAKKAAGLPGWLTPREYSTLAKVGENHTRTSIREHTIEFIRIKVNNQDRVLISPAEVLKRLLPDLMSPTRRPGALAGLRDRAKVARVEFDFESIERNVELLLNAMNAQPVMEPRPAAPVPAAADPWAVDEPVTERELAEAAAN